ncbi:MAG: right-handed parallel beta-helix repeat-containing protein [Phycisphaerales bacterium]|nr:right-handed parallel beta-helix repeat-containing protein [Phycisphaerales bacterium]
MNRIATVVAGLSLAFFGTSTSFAATYTVCDSGCDFTSIQDAINYADDGDTISLHPIRYYESNLSTGGKAITIQGTSGPDGTGVTTIDAQQTGGVFVFGSGEGHMTVIKDMVITGGLSVWGGGVYCVSSSPTIVGCTITGNSSSNNGGGIHCNTSSISIIDCSITNNTSGAGGGISCGNSTTPSIIGCTISGNLSTWGFGGGIRCAGSSPTITACVISNNSTLYDPSWNGGFGGGIYLKDCGPSLVTACTITGNHAATTGGGICSLGSSNPTIVASSVCGNSPDQITTAEWGGSGIGSWTDGGGNEISPLPCGGPGDVDGDGDVDLADLVAMRALLGICKSDVDSDYDTDVMDLLGVIDGWGGVCP